MGLATPSRSALHIGTFVACVWLAAGVLCVARMSTRAQSSTTTCDRKNLSPFVRHAGARSTQLRSTSFSRASTCRNAAKAAVWCQSIFEYFYDKVQSFQTFDLATKAVRPTQLRLDLVLIPGQTAPPVPAPALSHHSPRAPDWGTSARSLAAPA